MDALEGGPSGSVLPPFEAPFLWQPITFRDAVDLGGAPAALVDAGAGATPLVVLTEVGATSGLASAVSGGNGHGVGIAFVDIDDDDDDDIFIANGKLALQPLWFDSGLYRNEGDGTFQSATEASGVGAILEGRDAYSVAVADFDADGDFDLYVTTQPTDLLLVNDGTGHFTDGTAAAGAGGPPSSALLARGGRSKIAAWGDVDGDGWMDLAVASSSFEAAPLGYLLRNQGDGTFTDVTDSSGFHTAPTGHPCAVMWSDYDNDGDQDLWIWNDQGTNTENRVLLRNDGGSFIDVTVEANLIDDVGNPMGIDGADLNRDGWLDYYVSDIGGNALFLSGGDGTFQNVARSAGVSGIFGWGLGFEDLNADSWWDIFVAQEDVYDYLSFTHLGADPPSFQQQSWTHAQILDRMLAHNVAVAFADYDKTGTVDVVTATTDGSRISLFRNDTDLGEDHWLEVRVGRTPRTHERGGISARVIVKAGDLVLYRDINGGSSRASNNATSARFGLGPRTGADWVAALWPDGRELSAINVPGNRVVTLEARD